MRRNFRDLSLKDQQQVLDSLDDLIKDPALLAFYALGENEVELSSEIGPLQEDVEVSKRTLARGKTVLSLDHI